MSELDKWDSFYVIIGPTAGALIGLQFVVMTLVAERPPVRAAEATPVFATPTIVHFSAALLLSALIRMPWEGMMAVTTFLTLAGFGGAAYIAFVARRMRAQAAYQPDFEDQVFHILLPLGTYLGLAVSALAALYDARDALFGVGAATLLLLFIGIHNTWDSIAYLVFNQMNKAQEPGDEEKQ